MRRITSRSVLVLALGLILWPQSAAAQLQRGPRFLVASNDRAEPARVDVKRTPILRRNVSLDFRDVTVKDALAEISRQTGLDLIYADDVVPVAARVSLRAEGITAAAALTHVLADAGVDVVFTTGRRAMLVRQPPLEPIPVVGAITGIVLRTGHNEPIATASVAVEGTRHSALTDGAGRFRIEGVPAGRHSVRVSALGYRDAAQVVEISDGANVTLEFALSISPLPLDEVVVTGTVSETSVRALPTPITVVSAEAIERLGVQNVPEILRMTVPGLVHTYEGPTATYGRFSVRGVSNIQGAASTLKVYIDGAEVADATSIVNLDPSLIDRIEIISGPQASTMYGSRAISGVMQIFTRKGSQTGWRPVVSGGAAFKMMESEFVDGTPTGHRVDLSATGGGQHLTYTVGGNVESVPEWLELFKKRDENLFGRANFAYGRFSGGVTLQFRRGHQETYWDPFSLQIDREVGRASRPPNSGLDNRYQTNVLNLKFAATPRWQHNITAGYNTYAGRSHSLRPGADGLYSMGRRSYHRQSVAYNTALHMPLTEDFASTVTFGADYSKYKIRSASFKVEDQANYEPPEEEELFPRADAGFFGQAQLGFRDFLYLTGGLRADRNPEGSSARTTWSPRVGLSAVRDLGVLSAKARVAWGQAVIIPEEFQVLGDGGREKEGDFAYILPSPDLRAQIQRGYDAGVDLYYGDRASLGVTYFDQNPIDLMQLTNLGPDENGRTQWQYQNLQEVSNKGWEIKATVDPVEEITLQVVYGRTVSTIVDLGPNYTGSLESGQRITGQPDYTVSGSLGITPFRGTTLTTSAYRHGSWRFNDYLSLNRDFAAGTYNPAVKPFSAYEIAYPAFTKFNVGLTQAFGTNLTGILQIENAGNSDAPELSNSQVQRPRTISFGLRFTGL